MRPRTMPATSGRMIAGTSVEGGARVPPALGPDEVRIEGDEGVVLFQRALHEERDCSLRGVEVRVEIDAAGPRQVIDDERGIGDAPAGVLDERQLALGSLARIRGVDDLVGNPRNPQPGLELAAERAQVRDPEHARELEQLDGRAARCSSCACSLRSLSESLQETTPVAGRVEDGAHLVTTCPVAVEVTMLQLDARGVLALGDEAHLQLPS